MADLTVLVRVRDGKRYPIPHGEKDLIILDAAFRETLALVIGQSDLRQITELQVPLSRKRRYAIADAVIEMLRGET